MLFTLGLKKLPFELIEKQIIYVENQYDEDVNRYIQANYDAIQSYFKQHGYEFCYLPKIAEEVSSKEVIEYNAPYAEGYNNDVVIGSNFMLDYMINPENRSQFPPSLIYYDPHFRDENYPKSATLYRGVSLTPDTDYTETDNLSNVLSIIINNLTPSLDYRRLGAGRKPNYSYDKLSRQYSIDEESTKEPIVKEPEPLDDEFDIETLQMIEELKAISKKSTKKGIDIYVLLKHVEGAEKPSRLYITKDYRIFLKDYQNKEVRMTPLPKTLYLLYLKYPEGIVVNDLVDYRDELMDIYKKLKGGFFNEDDAKEKIDVLTDHTKNSVYEKISRIREAFKLVIIERITRQYYSIEGERLDPRKIGLPRNLVEWE